MPGGPKCVAAAAVAAMMLISAPGATAQAGPIVEFFPKLLVPGTDQDVKVTGVNGGEIVIVDYLLSAPGLSPDEQCHLFEKDTNRVMFRKNLPASGYVNMNVPLSSVTTDQRNNFFRVCYRATPASQFLSLRSVFIPGDSPLPLQVRLAESMNFSPDFKVVHRGDNIQPEFMPGTSQNVISTASQPNSIYLDSDGVDACNPNNGQPQPKLCDMGSTSSPYRCEGTVDRTIPPGQYVMCVKIHGRVGAPLHGPMLRGGNGERMKIDIIQYRFAPPVLFAGKPATLRPNNRTDDGLAPCKGVTLQTDPACTGTGTTVTWDCTDGEWKPAKKLNEGTYYVCMVPDYTAGRATPGSNLNLIDMPVVKPFSNPATRPSPLVRGLPAGLALNPVDKSRATASWLAQDPHCLRPYQTTGPGPKGTIQGKGQAPDYRGMIATSATSYGEPTVPPAHVCLDMLGHEGVPLLSEDVRPFELRHPPLMEKRDAVLGVDRAMETGDDLYLAKEKCSKSPVSTAKVAAGKEGPLATFPGAVLKAWENPLLCSSASGERLAKLNVYPVANVVSGNVTEAQDRHADVKVDRVFNGLPLFAAPTPCTAGDKNAMGKWPVSGVSGKDGPATFRVPMLRRVQQYNVCGMYRNGTGDLVPVHIGRGSHPEPILTATVERTLTLLPPPTPTLTVPVHSLIFVNPLTGASACSDIKLYLPPTKVTDSTAVYVTDGSPCCSSTYRGTVVADAKKTGAAEYTVKVPKDAVGPNVDSKKNLMICARDKRSGECHEPAPTLFTTQECRDDGIGGVGPLIGGQRETEKDNNWLPILLGVLFALLLCCCLLAALLLWCCCFRQRKEKRQVVDRDITTRDATRGFDRRLPDVRGRPRGLDDLQADEAAERAEIEQMERDARDALMRAFRQGKADIERRERRALEDEEARRRWRIEDEEAADRQRIYDKFYNTMPRARPRQRIVVQRPPPPRIVQMPAPAPIIIREQAPAPPPVVIREQVPAPPPVVIRQQAPAPPPVVIREQAPAPPPVVIREQAPAPPPVVIREPPKPAPAPVFVAPTPAPKPVPKPQRPTFDELPRRIQPQRLGDMHDPFDEMPARQPISDPIETEPPAAFAHDKPAFDQPAIRAPGGQRSPSAPRSASRGPSAPGMAIRGSPPRAPSSRHSDPYHN